MSHALKRLFELDATVRSPIEVFGDDAQMMADTWVTRNLFSKGPNVETVLQWDRRDFERNVAPITGRGAASVQVKGPDKSIYQAPPFFVRINIPLTAHQVNAVRALGRDGVNSNASVEINAAKKQLRAIWLRTVELLLTQCLKGTTTVNSTVFPAGTTVEGVSISWGVTALSVSASWATAGTKIVSTDLKGFRKTMTDLGVRPVMGLASEDIYGYFDANTEVSGFLSGLPSNEKRMLAEPSRYDGMGRIRNWVEYGGSYKPVGGSVTRFIADDEFLLIPEGYKNYLEYADAAMDIPKIGAAGVVARSGNISVQPDGAPDKAYGYHEYCIQEADPVQMKLVAAGGIAFANKYAEAFGYESDVTS